MQMCLAEIKKRLKQLEQEKETVLADERGNCFVTYSANESRETALADKAAVYDFAAAREAVRALDTEIRKLRICLNTANNSAAAHSESNMTIGECLIMLAQLNNEIAILEKMSRFQPKSRSTTFNIIEYKEILYDITQCREALADRRQRVQTLQMDIDRANLTTFVSV